MPRKPRNKSLAQWLRRMVWRRQRPSTPRAGPRVHVVILDGTNSSLRKGDETHAGTLYKLLCETPGDISIYYEPGVQWTDWRATWNVVTGKGINRQIRRAYGYLASRYRPGDKIYFFGYSRGAFAVRSLAGLIDRIGLLRAREATQTHIEQAYDFYRHGPDTAEARHFSESYCHAATPVEMIGVWDTVKALGVRLPLIWRLFPPSHAFHNHALGATMRNGFHALAHDETRQAYAPVLWETQPGGTTRVEQVWFPGNHGDVGGQIAGFERARPLANVSLVWMLGNCEACGLALPEDWRTRFECDPAGPSMGSWLGWSKIFVLRKRREPLKDASERLHPSLNPQSQTKLRKGAPAHAILSQR